MRKLVLVVCLLTAVTPLRAQQGSAGVDGLSFVAPMQVGVGYDNNFIVDRTNLNEKLFILSLPPSVHPGAPDVRPKPLDDQVLTFSPPKLAFQNDGRRHELILSYVPEAELFRTNRDQNAWNHEASVNFMYDFSRRIQVSAGDTYRSSKDPARTLQNVFLLLPRSRFQDNSARAAVDFQTSAVTGFRLRYDNTRSTFGQTDPFQARILDNTGRGLSFAVTRMLAPNHRVRLTYSYFKVAPINRTRTNDDAVDVPRAFERPLRGVTLEYRVRRNPSTIFEFTGGATVIDTGLNYVFQATADKRYGGFWFGGGFSRTLSFSPGSPRAFANGASAAGFYDMFSFRMRGQATRSIAIRIDARGSRDSSARLAQASKSFLGALRIDHRLTDRTVAYAGLQSFLQNRNDYVRTPLARTRFMMGIEFSLSSEAERRTNQLNQDEQYVALTDHARRRTEPQ